MKIALIGNQNSGKSLLFNHLTGSNQKIGNWPGVTIERKTGIIRTTEDEIIDLPGVYSLAPYSEEEKIVRNFLLEEDVDLILNVVDQTAIERSLYLTTQLLEFNIPVLVVLNMSDLAFEQGIRVNQELLGEMLNVTTVPISALKKSGIKDLIHVIRNRDFKKKTDIAVLPAFINERISALSKRVSGKEKTFAAIKMLENDPGFTSEISDIASTYRAEIEAHYKGDILEIIADYRYQFITHVRNETVSTLQNPKTRTDKIDRVLLNKYFAIPFFIIIMFLVYFIAAGPVGQYLTELIETGVDLLRGAMQSWLPTVGASPWAVSLLTDGILVGVGAIISFLPQLILLFFLIALLETSGYLPRVAFVFDRLFQKVGLSGKTIIPFIIGSGCSVPGIMATRTIHDEREKKMAIMLTPFVPCSAKLPVITLFAGFFFPNIAGLVSAALYFLAIIIILLSALILKRVFKATSTGSFISELPTYKRPNFNYIVRDTYEKSSAFVVQAGTLIFLLSLVIWLLVSFNWQFQYAVPVNESILSDIGRMFAWFFYPFLGEFSWEASVSILQGLVAKEQVISSMAIIANVNEGSEGLRTALFASESFRFFTPASAFAFMAFNLFSAPCFGAIGAMQKEFGSTRKMLFAVLFQTGIAYVIATLIYQFGHLLEVLI
ncbi:MAG TPA: ferrous iron transport protein B [Bacilli bacterium]|nr:ferrous iron transport protein B [Bacilli bacterium]